MNRHALILTVPAALLLAASAIAQEIFVEGFEENSNVGGWSYDPQGEIHPTGGNPDAYFGCNNLFDSMPHPCTEYPGEPCTFTSDYRGRGVTSIGIDLKTFWVGISAEGRPLTITLRCYNGTPDNIFDDWAAAYSGPDIPLPGEGWLAYDFEIPSQETSLPDGWEFFDLGHEPHDPYDWNTLMSNVDQLVFFYGRLDYAYLVQGWGVGFDNVRITLDPSTPCPGDVNDDEQVNIDDLFEILAHWGEVGGDCDINADGIVNIDDVFAVLAEWGPCP